MKKVYGYIRVSSVKQGKGVSLQEQKEAIIRYAQTNQLLIVKWFEELETAAKQGRPLFNEMMKLLKGRKVEGLLIHKIDRSARNLKDWAALGDLIDQGIEIHFAHESLDMNMRGGRLAADIQAVIASDYIRNLRQEAIKGLYGRLKQGIYPFGAPIGYINNGGGQLKTIDPIQGPLVKKAFELYGSGKYTIRTLCKAMKEYGLQNFNSKSIGKTSMSRILNNPFYTGVMRVKNKSFPGKHLPLITSTLYMEVQSVLNGKTSAKTLKHNFLFRRLIKCNDCNYSLIGEKQKGYIYYRCHTKGCKTKSIREGRIEEAFINTFEHIQLDPMELQILTELNQENQKNWVETRMGIEESLKMQQSKLSQKLERLTDAYIEATIDKAMFESRKEKLLIRMQGLQNKTSGLSGKKAIVFEKVTTFLERLKTLKIYYIKGIEEEKRRIVKSITSNFSFSGKKPMITMKSPYLEIANRSCLSPCGDDRDSPRKCNPKVANMVNNLRNVDKSTVRKQMKQLLRIITSHIKREHNNAQE